MNRSCRSSVYNYSKLPPIKGVDWVNDYAQFKQEKGQINIGLGQGKALEIFNNNILEYREIERGVK